MKRCSKCGKEKPFTEFHKNKRAKDKLYAQCKSCKKEYDDEHSKPRIARYRLKNTAYGFDPYANPELKKCSTCKEKLERICFSEDITRFDGLSQRCKNCDCAKGDARRATEGTYTTAELRKVFMQQMGRCFYCKAPMGNFEYRYNWQADHFHPIAKGGTNWISNIVCTCVDCNQSKNDRLYPSEWKPARLYVERTADYAYSF